MEPTLLNLLALCIACFAMQSILLSIVLFLIDAAILGLIAIDESRKVDRFQSRFGPITSQKFLVYR